MGSALWGLASGQFGLSLMQVFFMFYYVKVYLNVFHIDNYYFTLAQAIFLVWNAINDVIFGYFMDSSTGWLRSRKKVVRYFAPLMAWSFIIMWMRAPYEQGIHLIVSLVLYDAFFSMLGVAWGACFAELGGGDAGRATAMKYSQLAILFSVNIIAVTEKASNSLENMWAFGWISVVVAFLGLFCLLYFSYTPSNLSAVSPVKERSPLQLASVKGVLLQKPFIAIVTSNCLHTARSVCHLNFASIATELLIPQNVLAKGSMGLSMFYAMCTVVPQLFAILSEKLIVYRGASRLLLDSYALTCVSAVLLYPFSSSPYIVLLFMWLDSIFVHATAPFFNIILSEFIEVETDRIKKSVSSTVFGLNALFVKPFQSLAPLAVVWILSLYGYREDIHSPEVSSAMLVVLFIFPLISAAIQYFSLKVYLDDDGRRKKYRKESFVL